MPQTESRNILPIARGMKRRKNIKEITSSFSLCRAVTELAQFSGFQTYHDWDCVDCETIKFSGTIGLMKNIQVDHVLFCIPVLLLISTPLCLEHYTPLFVLALVHSVALFFPCLAGNCTHLCRAWHRNVIFCLKPVNKQGLVRRN